MIYSAYKLNKQGILPWSTPFTIWNESVFPCPVLTVASWPAFRFLRKQVRWSGIPISWRIFQVLLCMIYIVKAFGIVSKAEVDAFQELSCFFDDPKDVNLISGFSAFSKSRLYIWKFMIHIPPKLGLENFEHYSASVWDECDCVVVWTLLAIIFLWNEMKTTFCSPVATAEFSKFAGILSAAISQHHLSGFEIAQLEFPHLH